MVVSAVIVGVVVVGATVVGAVVVDMVDGVVLVVVGVLVAEGAVGCIAKASVVTSCAL